MRNICMKISYDGTLFNGYQNQPHMRTVQGEIERIVCKFTKEPVTVHASGRTDAGVHARGQVVHFLSNLTIPIERIPVAFNTRLPKDIIVLEAYEKDETFHSRHYAKKKTY